MSRQSVSFGRKPSGSVTQSDVCPYSLLGFNENERSEFEDKDARGETVAVDRALLQRFTQKIAENASDPDAKGDLTGAFMLLRSAQTRKACLMQRLVREKEGQKMGGIVERLLTRNIYGQVLRAIKSIGGDFSALRLPRIVIIGDENTGKSSTLERIAMRRCFPRSSSLCTRMALRLRMVHSWDERLMFLKHVNSNGEVKTLLEKRGKVDEPGLPPRSPRFPTSDDITAEDVLRAMESVVKERFNSSTIEPHMFLLDDSLEIEIVAPDVPTLEIVDLPGWVQGNPELREQTRALILKHLDPNEDNLVLCVVSGQADSLRSSAILQLLSSEKCAHALPWTVGVITKADVIARPPLGRPSKLLEVLRDVKQGSSNYSSLPFIVPVVNRECSAQAPEELDRLTDLLPLWAKLENERLFFSQLCEDLTPLAQGPKETFNPNDMGLDGLLKQLMRLFRAYMKEKWAVRELKNMRAEREKTKQKLFSLGKDPKDIALPDLIRAAAAQLEKTVARMEPEIEKVVSGTEGGEGETDGLSDWMIDLSAEGFDDTDSGAESSRLERARLRRYKHDRCEEALRDLPQTLARLAEKVIQTAFEDGSPHDESGLRLCRFENLKKSWLKAATTPEATALCVRKEKEAVDPPLQCARLKWTEWVDVVYEWFLLPTLGQTRERFNLEGGKTLLEENCAEERMALHARLDAIARGIRILKRLRDAPADGDDDSGEPARPSVAATHVDDSSDEEGGDFGDGLLEEFEVGGDEFPEPPGGAEEEEGEGEEEEEDEGTEGDDESLSSPTARLTTEEIRNVRRSTVGRQSLCLAEGEVLTEFLPSYEVVGEDGEEGCGDMNTPPAIAEGAGAAGTEGGQAGMDVQASRRQTEALRLEAMQVAPIRGTLEDLLDAARTGQRKSVKGLLAFGVDVNGKAGPDGRTALHMAAENNKRDVLTLLLLRGADVDVRDKFGMTPLHLAVRHGRKEICTILLEMNASVGAKSNGGCTPLHIAAQYNRKEICSLLLDHGAKVNCKDGLSYTPLHRAAQYGKKEMVSLLVERGAEVNTKDNIGWTPFRVATGEAAAILRARGGTH